MARVSFTEHPAAVQETYLEHLSSACSFGGRMILGGLACLIHGFLPFLFLSMGSRTIILLHDRMVTNCAKQARGLGKPGDGPDGFFVGRSLQGKG